MIKQLHIGAEVVLVWLSVYSSKDLNMFSSTNNNNFVQRVSLLITLIFIQTLAFAQDTTYSTSTTTASEELWYLQPWVWVAGGVVLLLLLIAMFSGGKKKNNNNTRTDKVIITKTVRTETDVD